MKGKNNILLESLGLFLELLLGFLLIALPVLGSAIVLSFLCTRVGELLGVIIFAAVLILSVRVIMVVTESIKNHGHRNVRKKLQGDI